MAFNKLTDLHDDMYWDPHKAAEFHDSFRRKDHDDNIFLPSIGTQYVFGNGAVFPSFKATSRYAELYNAHPGPPFERGGPLLNVSRVYDYDVFRQQYIKGPGTREYKGEFVPNVYGSLVGEQGLDSLASSCPVNLSFYGPKGWERYKPNAPKAKVARAIIEARQLPHMFFKHTRDYTKRVLKGQHSFNGLAKNTAREYLNSIFGWQSFLNDVKQVIQGVLDYEQNVEEIVDSLRLRDGIDHTSKHTEGYVFQDRTSSTFDSGPVASSLYPVLNSNFYPTLTGGRYTTDTTTKIDYWFSAKWKYVIEATLTDSGGYYIPDDVRARLKRVLFSFEMNPATFWDVMPWTWLIGWSTNVSTNLHNLVDPLLPEQAAEYAFIMGSHETENRTIATQVFTGGVTVQRSCTRTTTWKMRKTASPFGFGIQFASLSAKQIAILAALGISKYL